MPPKTKFQSSFTHLYDEVKTLDLSKPASKKAFMELIETFLKDEPVERKKESAPVEPIPVDLPSAKKKATARKPKKSENEEGDAKAKKSVIVTSKKKQTSAKNAQSPAK